MLKQNLYYLTHLYHKSLPVQATFVFNQNK